MSFNESLIKSKEKIARLFKDKKSKKNENERIPPGQHLTEKFPVLDLGIQPDFDPKTYKLKVSGLVEKEIELNEGLFHNGKGSVIRFVGRKK